MSHIKLMGALLATTLVSALAATGASADTMKFHADMKSSTEVPPNTSKGSGEVMATLDTGSKMLTWHATFKDLTGPASAGHFHGPAAPGANAGVVVPWKAPITSPVDGTMTLTDAQIADLETGKWYANVHTAANPGGEIRGQMVK